MRERKTRLAVLAAAVAVVVFVLGACIFPVAWSPDSKRVVFSIPLADPDKGMAHGLAMADRLAMVDLEGKMIRDVARVGDSENESFSPAAWSPDGKWIAYFRFEPKPAEGALDPDHPEEDEATILVSLMLQEADSGKEGIIFQEDVPKDNYDWGANALYGPQWTADSKALMIRNMSAAQPGLVVLNLQGGIVLDVPLDDELGRVTAALSPDGASLAYLRRLPFKDFDWQWEICVLDIKAGTTRVLGQGVSEDGPWGRPAWSADARFLYVTALEKVEDEEFGAIRRIDVKTGKPLTVWQKQYFGILNVTVSPGTARLAVVFDHQEASVSCIEIMEADGAKATPVHFGPMFYGSQISPDGKWVAFGAPVGDEEEFLGVIVSADGARLRFFAPDEERRDELIVDFMRERIEGALNATGAGEELEEAIKGGEEEGRPSPANSIKSVHAVLDRVAREHKAPIFQEALAFGRAGVYLSVLVGADADEIKALLPEARQHLKAFLDAYPEHAFGMALGRALDELSGE